MRERERRGIHKENMKKYTIYRYSLLLLFAQRQCFFFILYTKVIESNDDSAIAQLFLSATATIIYTLRNVHGLVNCTNFLDNVLNEEEHVLN